MTKDHILKLEQVLIDHVVTIFNNIIQTGYHNDDRHEPRKHQININITSFLGNVYIDKLRAPSLSSPFIPCPDVGKLW